MAISWVHLKDQMSDGLRSIMSDDPEDIAIRERLHREAVDREAAARTYYAEIEHRRGITHAPGTTRFRPQRGGLVKALEEVVEVSGRAGLIEHLRQRYPSLDPAYLTIEPYGGDDERIGWKDVHIVALKDWGPVGFCEGKPA